MALGKLEFRSHHVAAQDTPNGITLRGDVRWWVEGPDSEIRALSEAVGSAHAYRVNDTVLSLRFGNSVGQFEVKALGILDVRCGKWGEETFHFLLLELCELASSLPYATERAAGAHHERRGSADGIVLLHAFVYAREIIMNGPLPGSLDVAMRAILANPHRAFRVQRERVSLADVNRIDSRTLARLVSGAELMELVAPALVSLPLAKYLRGQVPIRVDVPCPQLTLDTAENRFVLFFLLHLRDIIERTAAFAAGCGDHKHFWDRVRQDAEQMRRALRPWCQHALWEGVGRSGLLPEASSVLQRRQGYRAIFKHHILLRAAIRWPADPARAQLMGLKDISALYEMWCYFKVVSALIQLLGPPDAREATRVEFEQTSMRWGFCVEWKEVTAYFNLSFSNSKGHPQHLHSFSMLLRPDIVIVVTQGDERRVHVLDAKLRLQRDAASQYEPSDVVKMHAYRDALPAVRTSFVLYPGQQTESWKIHSQEVGAVKVGAVGVISLVPGGSLEALLTHLRDHVVPGPSGQWTQESGKVI